MPLTCINVVLHINFELFYCKCGKEKESVFRDYVIIELVQWFIGEKKKYQVTKLAARAKLSRFSAFYFKLK